eukprot:scaffold1954_cov268-Pinguiococcus_pyrenoidosus.AAC.1
MCFLFSYFEKLLSNTNNTALCKLCGRRICAAHQGGIKLWLDRGGGRTGKPLQTARTAPAAAAAAASAEKEVPSAEKEVHSAEEDQSIAEGPAIAEDEVAIAEVTSWTPPKLNVVGRNQPIASVSIWQT